MIIDYNGMSGFLDYLKWIVAPATSSFVTLIKDDDLAKTTTDVALKVDERDIIDTTPHAPIRTAPTIPDQEIQLPVTQEKIEKSLPDLPEVMPKMPQGMTTEEYMALLRRLEELISKRRRLESEKNNGGINLKTITEYLPFVGIGTGIFKAIWGSK